MNSLAKVLAVVSLFGLIGASFAQRGAAGYGQGRQGGGQGGQGMGGPGGGFGGGGGMGGSFGGRNMQPSVSRDEAKAKPDEEQAEFIWQTHSAILTPGDRVEYKLKLKKGETVFAGVTSDAFDPALAMVDPAGKTLTQNDDRVEGDQSPFLILRAPTEGNYVLKVLSFHSVAGGKFTIRMRTFLPIDITTGKDTHDLTSSVSMNNGQRRFTVVVNAKKGNVYDLREIALMSKGRHINRYWASFLSVVGPTGVADSDIRSVNVPPGTTGNVFEAKADGSYYIEFVTQETSEATTLETQLSEIVPVTIRPNDSTSFDLQGQELKILDMPVTPKLVVHTTITGAFFNYILSGKDSTDDIGGDPLYRNSPGWASFKTKVTSNTDVVRLFHREETVRFAIRSYTSDKKTITIKNVDSVPEWKIGDTVKEPLGIGESKIYQIKSTKSELMRVYAKAPQFLARMDIYQMNGELANSLMNRSTLIATDDLYFPDADTFLVTISCDGNGGSGEFTMKRNELEPMPYALGAVQTMKLDGENFGLFSVSLEVGKQYELLTDNAGYLSVDLVDDDGQFLTSQRISFGTVNVDYFTPTKSGRHRLWLRGSPGAHSFKLSIHVAPTLGTAAPGPRGKG